MILNLPVARPAEIIKAMPWYTISPWESDEVQRVFHLSQKGNPSVHMPGLIFHQYNLSAVANNPHKEDMGDSKKLLQWLDLFGPSGEKRLNDVLYLQEEEPALWKAYEMLTHLPEDVAQESEKEQEMYHITQQEKEISS